MREVGRRRGHEFVFTAGLIGEDAYDRHGHPLPPEEEAPGPAAVAVIYPERGTGKTARAVRIGGLAI